VWAAALPRWCPDAGVAAVIGEEPVVMPRGCRHMVEPRYKTWCFGVVLVCVISRFDFALLGLSLPCFDSNKWYQSQIQGEDPHGGAMGVFHTAQGHTSCP
jgi:hypothetical protein